MQKEYLFYNQNALDFPLHEEIEVATALKQSDEKYLVSNTKETDNYIYAPEINFYLQNSQDDISDKILNVKALYDARATNYDFAQDLDFEVEVGKKLLIVSEKDESALVNEMNEIGFTSMVIDPYMIKDVYGHIGALKVVIQKNKDEEALEVETDQIVWFNAPEFAMTQSGTFDPNVLGLDEAIFKVKANDGSYKYKNFIKYDSKICQYHERKLEETCGRCADICPTVAILKVDERRHLEFSHVDCHGCGGCISICPSGALEYSQMPRIAFTEICSFYEDKTAFIIPEKMKIENLNIELPQGVLPLAIAGEKFLHEAHFMSLIQTSGNPVVFFTDFISKGTGDVIRIINEIFEKKYGKKAIFVCQNEEEALKVFKKLQPIPECKYGINEEGMAKREVFSARLAHLVGQDDLGTVTTGEFVHYGNIKINEDNCTLCLSCVGACNVRALTAHPEDNTLRFNPSICTNCTYCEVACPEKDCLSVIKDEISLKPEYFVQNIMAKDELFECVECGKKFATVKSVEKIASVMKPIFAGDENKIKSLYCCADCKPKVTLMAAIQKQREGIE